MISDPIRIGVLRLTDSAPVIVAHELGYFADEGVETILSVEPSWANVADKLAYGALEAACIVPPLAIAVSLGLRGTARGLIVPYALSLGGNAVTIARPFADAVKADGGDAGAAFATRVRGASRPKLSTVHEYSTHNLQLRYWLATLGLAAERDYELVVTPPERTVEALRAGRILGFCAGAPWAEVAARAGVGATIVTGEQIWRHAPEKVFALRQDWAEAHPNETSALLRGLYRASRFCDKPENAAYVAALLGRRAYLHIEPHAILASLPGTAGARSPLLFHRHAATYPWLSHARWMQRQMARWGLVADDPRARAEAVGVYRPDIYAAALATVGAPIPLSGIKPEGGHNIAWRLEAVPTAIEMEADAFCDGAKY